MTFSEKLQARINATRSALCVGLDPRPQSENLSELEAWLNQVIEETAPYTAAYKPNIAYFEAMGLPGLQMLENLLKNMPKERLACCRTHYFGNAHITGAETFSLTCGENYGFNLLFHKIHSIFSASVFRRLSTRKAAPHYTFRFSGN